MPCAVRELVVTDTSRMGGVAETEQTAVAVRPTGSPFSELVMMVTPEARCRITSRKAAPGSCPSGCDMALFPPSFSFLLVAFVPLGRAFGEIPHAFFQFLLPRIVLVTQHRQAPRIS